MTMDAYLRSGYQVQNHVPEELMQSQSSGILYQENYLSQGGGSSVVRPINLSHSVGQIPYQNAQFVTGDINIRVYSSPINSGLSIEESSLITDANSSLSGGSYMSSINSIESPASNCAISGSAAGDHFSAQQQNSEDYQTGLRWYKRQGEPFSNPIATPQLIMPYQASVSPARTFKKPRLEISHDLSCLVQQPSHFQCPMQLRGYDPELAASLFIQQNLLANQQHMLNSLVSPQRLQIQSQPPQQLLVDSQNAGCKGSIYLHRLMCYIHHQRQRPPVSVHWIGELFLHATRASLALALTLNFHIYFVSGCDANKRFPCPALGRSLLINYLGYCRITTLATGRNLLKSTTLLVLRKDGVCPSTMMLVVMLVVFSPRRLWLVSCSGGEAFVLI